MGGEGDFLRHVLVIGQVRGDVQVHAAVGDRHADHLQGAGIDVEAGEKVGHALLVGLDGDGGVRVADGDGGVLLQGEVIAPGPAGDVEHLGREVWSLLLGGVQDDGALVLCAGDEEQGVGPAGGGQAGDGGGEQTEQHHAAPPEQGV